jgi:hypothetical protein
MQCGGGWLMRREVCAHCCWPYLWSEGTHFSLNGEEFSGGLGYGSELVGTPAPENHGGHKPRALGCQGPQSDNQHKSN